MNLSVVAILALAMNVASASVAAASDGLPEACLALPDPGDCSESHLRYYYDQGKKQCRTFAYSGCGGNVPFKAIETCRRLCTPKKNRMMMDMKLDGATCLMNPCSEGETCVDDPYRNCFVAPV
ncbi:hypothetical protein HDU67_004497 [Dinochytrium kinnereticum]|nr:hypothetical protein HDU67_004497 [Dinochytrium kinnereticum]